MKSLSPTIFDPFYRMYASTKVPGWGLGLPTCKRIIQKHHGKIKLESTLEKEPKLPFHSLLN